MVANLRCAELGDAALAAMTASSAFTDLASAASSGPPLPDFGARAAGLVEGGELAPWTRGGAGGGLGPAARPPGRAAAARD